MAASNTTQEGMLTGSPSTSTESEEMKFTFIEGRERGGQQADYLYKQMGKPQQVTVEELRAYFNDPEKVNRLPEVFGTFDNYLAYMTEREQLIQSGEYDIGDWANADPGLTMKQRMLLQGEDLFVDADDETMTPEYINRQITSAQRSGYTNWINSEANQALLAKYGVAPTVYSKTGDKFQWNGSAYVKTVDEKHAGLGDYIKVAVGVGLGAVLGPAIGSALTGTSAAAGTAASALQGAVNATIGSAISQGAITGSIDGSQLLTAGLTGGISGIADGIRTGELAGTALDNAVWDLSGALGMSVDETVDILQGVATGAITGSDIESMVVGAVQGYTTAQIKDGLTNIFGSEVDVQNVFDEGTTTIPMSAFDPFVETAVEAAFEGEIQPEDVVEAIYDYSQEEGGTFAFLDPGIDLPDVDLFEGTLPDFETPEEIKQIEDVARAVGSEVEDVTRDVVRPIGEAAEEIKEALPQGTTPDLGGGLDIEGPDLPDVNLPDVDLPGIDLEKRKRTAATPPKPFMTSIGYQPVQLQQLIAPPKRDYVRELDGLFGRLLG